MESDSLLPPAHPGLQSSNGAVASPSAKATIPGPGSAFQKVVQDSRSHNLPIWLYPISSPDFLHGGTASRHLDFGVLMDYQSSPSSLEVGAEREYFKDLYIDSCNTQPLRISADSKICVENKLPFKKRRRVYQQIQEETGIVQNEIRPEDLSKHGRKLPEVSTYDPSILLSRTASVYNENSAGKLQNWSSEKVKQWLQKALHSANINENYTSILQILHKKDGKDLSTLSRECFMNELTLCKVHPNLVWEIIYEKLQFDKLSDSTNDLSRVRSSTDQSEVMNPIFTGMCKSTCIESQEKNRDTLRNSKQSRRKRRRQCVGQLWEFIYALLESPLTNPSIICWEDESKKLFRILDTEEIARLWGEHKGNCKMTYASMTRTMRYYQDGNGAFVQNDRKRVYGFGPKADIDKLRSKICRK